MINANQVCVVTGAGKGIGRGIATVLAREGATVIAASRSAANLRITKEMIETAGGRAAAIPVDITDRPGVQAFVKQVIADFGRIDVLVNNAGLMPMPANLVDFDDQLWENLFRVNTTGTYNMIKAVLPHMMQQEFGRVINMSSVAARLTFPAFAAYGAAKAALHALTTALAKEVAVHKITVNCILPGFTPHRGDGTYLGHDRHGSRPNTGRIGGPHPGIQSPHQSLAAAGRNRAHGFVSRQPQSGRHHRATPGRGRWAGCTRLSDSRTCVSVLGSLWRQWHGLPALGAKANVAFDELPHHHALVSQQLRPAKQLLTH